MEIQNIIVGIIVLLAGFYIGKIVWQKLKSFSAKSASCGSSCDCDAKSTTKNSLADIPR